MDRPWRVAEDGQVSQVPAATPTFAPGDWTAVERWLDVRLPSDYKELIGDGPALIFDDELLISSPFSASNHLGHQIAYGSWSMAVMRQGFPEHFGIPLFPEPGGLLCWGGDGGGANYYWDTAQPDPDHWTIVVSGRSVGDGGLGELHDHGLRDYLAGLAAGTIEAAALLSWPGPDPHLRRVSE